MWYFLFVLFLIMVIVRGAVRMMMYFGDRSATGSIKFSYWAGCMLLAYFILRILIAA